MQTIIFLAVKCSGVELTNNYYTPLVQTLDTPIIIIANQIVYHQKCNFQFAGTDLPYAHRY
jgi:hypothetical protein